MLRGILFFNLFLCAVVIAKRKYNEDDEIYEEIGGSLVTSLRDDANLDLPVDEEYEDLRAELLAYHTALASLTKNPQQNPVAAVAQVAETPAPQAAAVPSGRRSLKTTPCWELGGICVHFTLCKNSKYLTQVPGCKDRVEVCCRTWNQFQVRDFRDRGISNARFPWSIHKEFGGEGIVGPVDVDSGDDVRLDQMQIPYVPVIMQEQSDGKVKKSKKGNKGKKDKKKRLMLILHPK